MVSNASEDLPDPLNPVITVRVLRGISTSIFFRLCWRAPCTEIRSSIVIRVLGRWYPLFWRELLALVQLRYNGKGAQVRILREQPPQEGSQDILRTFQLLGDLRMP